MNEIPMWWLVLSSIFFALTALGFLGMAFAMLKMYQLVAGLIPTIQGVSAKVEDVSGQVSAIAHTVHGITQKVEQLTEKVHGIADSAKGQVETVGDRAKGLVTHLDQLATSSSGRFQAASGWIAGAMTAYKLWKSWQETRAESRARSGRYMPVPVDTNGSHRDNDSLHRGVEQSGSSSGS